MDQDWVGWHNSYDVPGSSLQHRLALVRRRLVEALDGQPTGPIRLLSMCAGQGRDVIEAMAGHPRRDDVEGLLVELNPGNAAFARRSAAAAGLSGIRVSVADASLSGAYSDIVPVDIALVCGVFGNISADDIRHTIGQLPRLCRRGATVIWTRHRRAPDLTPMIRTCFSDTGFTEVSFDGVEGYLIGVGTHQLTGPALEHRPDTRLFTFVGDGTEAFL